MRSAAHIAVLAFEKKGVHALAAAGGCYVGSAASPRRAKYEIPFLAVPRSAGYGRRGVHESLSLLVSRARKRPIASTGRQENGNSAC